MNDALPSPALSRTVSPKRVLAALAASVSLATATGLLAGCGSSKPPSTSADPASVTPAGAVIYVGATVRPPAAVAKQALAAGRAFTHQANPFLQLLAALQTPGSATLDYSRDVAPWLGAHAGIFLSSWRSSSGLPLLLERGLLGSGSSGSAFPFTGGGAEGAIVLDTSNATKAHTFLEGQARRAHARARSFRGIHYRSSPEGVCFAIVKRFAVIGSEAALHQVIESAASGGSLAQAGSYTKLLASAPAHALAHVYLKPAGTARPAGEEGLPDLLQALAGVREANASLLLAPNSLSVDADTLASAGSQAEGGLLSGDPQAAQALNELPGESWLAIGLGHLGATLSKDAQDIGQLVSLGSALGSSGPVAPTNSFGLGPLLQALTAPLQVLGADNAQAKREFASWMGSAGIFASGASLLELRAAVSITSTNGARSRAAVGELAAALRKTGTASIGPASIPGADAAVAARLNGLPLPLYIADGVATGGQRKFVLGLGEASVTAALHPSSTLESSTSRAAAASSLGEGIQPSLIVSFPPLLSVFEAAGLLEAPPLSQFLPYLRTLGVLTGGGRQLSGEVQRLRLTVGLQ